MTWNPAMPTQKKDAEIIICYFANKGLITELRKMK